MSWEPTLWLRAQNPGLSVSPGVHLKCYGPFFPPPGAQTLRTFMPQVDIGIVHHMIMFAGRNAVISRTSKPGHTQLCYQGEIIYAWARTGQTAPLGLDLKDTFAQGDGFDVGPGSKYAWIAVEIHYQQLHSSPIIDTSGIRLGFSTRAPMRPLEVQPIVSLRMRIPPRAVMDECVTCRATGAGTVLAWRNHAHRLARDIYSEHFDRDGNAKSHLGLMSAQEPQIFRLINGGRIIEKGDTLLLHCLFNSSEVKDRVTVHGLDERTHEMCIQYLMGTSTLSLNCDADRAVPDPTFAVGGMGQAVGLAIDAAARTLYVLHRAKNDFAASKPIAEPAILAFSFAGKLVDALAPETFIVPHGLSTDFSGALWATDVALNQVLKLDPNAGGAVVQRLGSGVVRFSKPTDVAVHPRTHEVFVADGYGDARVAVFSYSGTFLRDFGSSGRGDGSFRVPHSLVFDRRGDLYVADRENSRVQIFDGDTGRYKSQWLSRVAGSYLRYPYSHHVSSISYDPTLDLFAVTEGNAVVLRTPTGCLLAQTDDSLKWPHDAVILPAATNNRTALARGGARFALFVAELDGKRVKRYNSVDDPWAHGQTGASSLYGMGLRRATS